MLIPWSRACWGCGACLLRGAALRTWRSYGLRLQVAGQLVRSRAGFHADQAPRQLRHEFEQRAAADGLAQHGLGLAVGVDAMHTEDVLGHNSNNSDMLRVLQDVPNSSMPPVAGSIS